MKKKIWIAIGVSILIAVFIGSNLWKATANNQVTVEVTHLEEEALTETIMVPGQLKLAEEQAVYYTPDKGEVEEIFVKEGDKVEKGIPLIRYKNPQLELEREQIELQLRSANLQVDDLHNQHEDIDELLEKDEDNEQLQIEHDQIKLQQQQANLELEQLKLQKQSLEQQTGDLTVESESSGTVVEVNENAAGASQSEHQPLIRIGTMDQMIVEGVISEYDTLKLEEGQSAVLSSDAVPDKSWEGEVSFISDLPKEAEILGTEGGTGSVQYQIEVTVEADDLNLKPGFQMIVEITTDEHSANTLPITAVKQDGDVNYVYVVSNGKAERRKVEVGSIADKTIEITDGLTNEDQTIVDPGDFVQDGMDVSIK